MKSPYLRLMRLHQPTGIWLLLWPCWWSMALATGGVPPAILLVLYGLGAILMRGAGCIINDMTDRKLDAQVERTKHRPLASGELSMKQAGLLLAILLAVSLQIALLLGPQAILWAAISLIPVAIYPWMKRISWWPQLFLGFTFNWGALMGWVTIRHEMGWPALALYVGGIFWTLGYDTIYAHQDTKDDVQAGIKSTALRLGARTKPALSAFYAMAILCWALALFLAGSTPLSYFLLMAAGLHFFWQIRAVRLTDPESCRRMFASNKWVGWIMMLVFALSKAVS